MCYNDKNMNKSMNKGKMYTQKISKILPVIVIIGNILSIY